MALAVGAEEVADAVRLLDHEPDFFPGWSGLVQFEFDEDVTGIELAVALAAFAVLDGADCARWERECAPTRVSRPRS